MELSKLTSRNVLGVLAVCCLMVLAGCSGPPSPPNQGEQTETPTPEPYAQSGAEVTYDNVYSDHRDILINDRGSFAVTYKVNIEDPRLDRQRKYQKRYLVNTQTEEYLYQSNYSGTNVQVYQDSVLYYERTGGENQEAQVEVLPLSEAPSDSFNLNEAAANSSLIETGMQSSSYTLQSANFTGDGREVSTYTASDSVNNYDVSDLIPEDMNYEFGNPSTTNENIESTITIEKQGLMTKYTFTYTSTVTVNGNEEQMTIEVTYTVDRSGTFIDVPKPSWAGGEEADEPNNNSST